MLYESQGQSQKTIQVNSTSTHLNSGVGLLGVEADPDGEEIVWASSTGELHGPGLTIGVDHGKLPKKLSTFFEGIVAVTF